MINLQNIHEGLQMFVGFMVLWFAGITLFLPVFVLGIYRTLRRMERAQADLIAELRRQHIPRPLAARPGPH